MGNRNITIPVIRQDNFNPLGGVNWLASDIIPDISGSNGQVVTIHIALKPSSAPSIIFYRITNAEIQDFNIAFLNGLELASGAGLERQITLAAGDKLNFRSSVGVEVGLLRVDLV